VVKRLGEIGSGLDRARYVFVAEKVELVEDFEALISVLRTRARTFGFLLDLSEIQRGVAERAARLRSPRAPAGSRLARD
jgi:predicted transcriptional regulator